MVYDLFQFLELADGIISPDRIKMDLQLLLWHCKTNSFEKGKCNLLELWEKYENNSKNYIFKVWLNHVIFKDVAIFKKKHRNIEKLKKKNRKIRKFD